MAVLHSLFTGFVKNFIFQLKTVDSLNHAQHFSLELDETEFICLRKRNERCCSEVITSTTCGVIPHYSTNMYCTCTYYACKIGPHALYVLELSSWYTAVLFQSRVLASSFPAEALGDWLAFVWKRTG